MIRSYNLKHFANEEKIKDIDSLFIEYRYLAHELSGDQWTLFYQTGRFNKNSKMDISSELSERYKQTCQYQVVGILESYVSQIENKIRKIVYNSSINEEDKKELYTINKYHLWYVKTDKYKKENRVLIRKIFKHVINQWSLSKFNNINLNLDGKVVNIKKRVEGLSSEYDYWLKLSTLNKRKPIYIPFKSNEYFESKEGKIKQFIQINKSENNYKFYFIKEIKEEKVELSNVEIGLDVGLKTPIVTSIGDLFGRKFYKTIEYYDNRIVGLQSNLQRQNIKPNKSNRYKKLISKFRSYVKNELNRIFNRIVTLYNPSKLIVEKLNFSNSKLSKKFNRLLNKFGKFVIQKKLDSLKEERKLEIVEINPAYTSQSCSKCNYIDKNNRKIQDKFQCNYCGYKIHADINASRQILYRSSIKNSKYISRKAILDRLVKQFIERTESFNSKAIRLLSSNPYFVGGLEIAKNKVYR